MIPCAAIAERLQIYAALNRHLLWRIIMLLRHTVVSASFVTVLLSLAIAPSASAVGWLDDFNDGNAEDGMPVTWTYNEVGFTPGTYDASSGDYILSNPNVEGDNDSLLPTVPVDFTDTYVRTQAVILPGMLPDQVGGTLGVVARWNPMFLSGYAALLSNGGHLELLRVEGGTPIDIGEADGLPVDTATDAIIELNIVGSDFSVYVWRPGEPKPAEPTVTAVDTVFESGRAGILFNENDDGVQGVFRFAAAQDMPFDDGLDGDFNNDGSVDAADYVVWRKGLGGDFTQDDYNVWRANFGRTAGGAAAGLTGGGTSSVPEVSSIVSLVLAIGFTAATRRWPRPLAV
jgi:hypothetical protein